jgi:sugar phosphate isomerase/epimerase
MSGLGADRLSLNQATVKHLGLSGAVALCVRHDIPAIGLWRDRVAEAGLASAAALVRRAGLHVSSLCRGGFFTQADPSGLAAARADNVAAVQEAASLGADALVLVCGGLIPGSRDLGLARRMVADAIGDLVPVAQRLGVRLGIEALHPMFCADRCVIASLGEAVDLALTFPADAVGVVVDTYHVWWDARLTAQIARAAGRIVSYQVCDWVLPLPADTLLGRGHVGDGVIDFGPITAAVAAAGYRGYVEVEIFNADVWAAPPDRTAAVVRERFSAILGPDGGEAEATPSGLEGRPGRPRSLTARSMCANTIYPAIEAGIRGRHGSDISMASLGRRWPAGEIQRQRARYQLHAPAEGSRLGGDLAARNPPGRQPDSLEHRELWMRSGARIGQRILLFAGPEYLRRGAVRAWPVPDRVRGIRPR